LVVLQKEFLDETRTTGNFVDDYSAFNPRIFLTD